MSKTKEMPIDLLNDGDTKLARVHQVFKYHEDVMTVRVLWTNDIDGEDGSHWVGLVIEIDGNKIEYWNGEDEFMNIGLGLIKAAHQVNQDYTMQVTEENRKHIDGVHKLHKKICRI